MNKNSKIEIFSQECVYPIRAGYTSRLGGVNSKWGLNLGYNTAEDVQEVSANRKLYETTLGGTLGFVYANQVHSDQILVVERPGIFSNVDGFVTREKNLVLNILTADCLGILAFDPVHEVIGAFHAGWKGTQSSILKKGLSKMRELGAEDNCIQIIFNPCIQKESYEVGPEFQDYFPQTDFFETKESRLYFDLVKANQSQLNTLQQENLHIEPKDTFRDSMLYSYRRDKEKAGRFVSFIYMQARE